MSATTTTKAQQEQGHDMEHGAAILFKNNKSNDDSPPFFQEQALILQRENTRLKRLILWVILGAILLALVMMATILVGAVVMLRLLSNDIKATVDPTTGLWVSAQTGTALATMSTGMTTTLNLEYDDNTGDGNLKFCITVSQLARLWNSTVQGTPTNLVFTLDGTADDDNNNNIHSSRWGASLMADGSFVTDTRACFRHGSSSNKDLICVDFADDYCSASRHQGNNRQLEQQGAHASNKHQHHRRRAAFQRALQLNPVCDPSLANLGLEKDEDGFLPGCDPSLSGNVGNLFNRAGEVITHEETNKDQDPNGGGTN